MALFCLGHGNPAAVCEVVPANESEATALCIGFSHPLPHQWYLIYRLTLAPTTTAGAGLHHAKPCPLAPSHAGRLNAAALCEVVAALQPAECIVMDESLTSGNSYWEASKGCPPFSHLTLTGRCGLARAADPAARFSEAGCVVLPRCKACCHGTKLLEARMNKQTP